MKWILASACVVLLAGGFALAQVPADVLGMHNLSLPSGASVYSQGSLGCTFCHAPHSGLGAISPLWNQTYSKATYTPYNSTTYVEQGSTARSRSHQQPLPELPRRHRSSRAVGSLRSATDGRVDEWG